MTSEHGHVDYGECTECGFLMLPIPALSPCGHSAPVETRPLSDTGVVYTWTRARLGASDQLMVMADFFDGRLRITAPLLESEQVSIGASVTLITGVNTPYAFVRIG